MSSSKIHPRPPLDKAKAHEVVWSQVSDLFAAAKVIANPSYVYFIGEEDEGALKIGLAADPIKRLRSMQTGNPRRLRVEYDHVAQGRDHVWNLAPGAGYSVARRSNL